MSALRLRSLPALRAHRPSPVARSVALRSMATRHGNDPEVLQKEKARNLRGEQDSSAPHKEHAPGWNEHLASDAEANVKADQAGPSGKPGKELQDATVGHIDKHHHKADGKAGHRTHDAPGPSPTDSEAHVRLVFTNVHAEH
ncbi:hypothetical protein, variant 2 [Cryptococcus amylolentus CBS 6039]|uniref:Uncharacterized protein n=1 Tax=Cryptococcus amylolentus CBS 6039 TaxID=1295533 RepID=A0A1E3I7Z1_9TREE|nr:hypothetical protein, variant 2 [Cryptococcus amylolentus CBS 6039]ODN84687.1 hypothetical protein, variant 2 [Cryptococcus amylolentus CBS 6039]